jgi:hypothetical protein
MAVHADNSVVVAWPQDITGGDSRVVLQRLNSAGEKKWGTGIVLTEAIQKTIRIIVR